jgi:short-subunit dehydrogenase
MPTTLITGASSGLGAEMARQLAARGHDLALCARRTDRLDELAVQVTTAHPAARVSVKALDVTDHDAVFRVFDEFAEELGGLDRVVVNAGIGKGARSAPAASRATARPRRPTSSARSPRPRPRPRSSAGRTPATS